LLTASVYANPEGDKINLKQSAVTFRFNLGRPTDHARRRKRMGPTRCTKTLQDLDPLRLYWSRQNSLCESGRIDTFILFGLQLAKLAAGFRTKRSWADSRGGAIKPVRSADAAEGNSLKEGWAKRKRSIPR
jgi:hypothetical protein